RQAGDRADRDDGRARLEPPDLVRAEQVRSDGRGARTERGQGRLSGPRPGRVRTGDPGGPRAFEASVRGPHTAALSQRRVPRRHTGPPRGTQRDGEYSRTALEALAGERFPALASLAGPGA